MWISKHIFIHDYQLIDYYLKDHLLPLLEQELEDQYFFIRYWDGGPHIRLRYLASNHSREFEHLLESSLEEFREIHKDWVFNPLTNDERVIQTEGQAQHENYPNFSIQNIEYVPEIERYGGLAVMIDSEDLFRASSHFANHIIQNIDRNKRYAIAFDLMYECSQIALELGLVDQLQTFFKHYNNVWQHFNKPIEQQFHTFLTERVKKLKKNGTLKPYKGYLSMLREKLHWIRNNQTIYDEKEIHYILISHIHMLNNRLGVSPENEYMFSEILLDYCENDERLSLLKEV